MAAASDSWNAGANGPTSVDALRTTLTALAKKKKGKLLIADKFAKDHIFAGHAGDVAKLAAMLAKLRDLSASTLLLTSMDANAQAEVLNWIAKVPANGFTRTGTTWKIGRSGTAVPGTASYKWATVDLAAFRAMNRDDVVKKSRNWLTLSQKTPKIACMFGADGTPVIYHLDY